MPKILKVWKRNGSFEDFSSEKIKVCLEKAFLSSGKSVGLASGVFKEVIRELDAGFFSDVVPKAEDIQDVIEEKLVKKRFVDVAEVFLSFRRMQKEVCEFRTFLGVRDELGLSSNAVRILVDRYLLRDDKGIVVETPSRLFRRVAKAVARADSFYCKCPVKDVEDKFYDMMVNLEFLPNSPTLMNAGTDVGQLSACFVLPIGDSLESIFDGVKRMVLVHKSGGGTGFCFSNLRPKGDVIFSTRGFASGPVSFLKVFDCATGSVLQGGRRRGANMAVLDVCHPDIFDFVSAKDVDGVLSNFNLSVSVSDGFMSSVGKSGDVWLVNPRNNEKVKRVSAKSVFDSVVNSAWKSGDPGLVFINEVNRKNQLSALGVIEAVNPCGEQPLFSFESCNLGSVNLVKMLKFDRSGKCFKIDWVKLKKTVHSAVHFLDNVIDVNKFSFDEIEKISKANRKIGLGIMGWAEFLIRLNIRYDSSKALLMAENVMKFLNDEARKASFRLAELRGSFPNFERSNLKKHFNAMRNATVTTIAPTGSLSIIAGVSSGIEPLFAVCFVRNILSGERLLELNSEFESISKIKGFFSKKLVMKIARSGSVKGFKDVPKNVQGLFKTALEISPEWHVRMQAAFQKFCDNGVSKTVNLPTSASCKDVAKVFLLAHKLKCKGITVYRYGSKKNQVLTFGGVSKGSEVAGSSGVSGDYCKDFFDGACNKCVF